jgi:hypothetical protein
MHLDDVLTELVEQSGDRLLRVAYQLTHDAAAAQDLVQEALLRVYQSVRHRGLAPEDWYAYMRRAVINEYVRTRRLRSSTEIVTDVVPERPAAGCEFEDDISRAMAAHDDEAPRAADLLRAYRGSNTARQQAGWALSGQRSLAGGLASLASQLTWKPHSPRQPIACTAVGGPQTNYLIGLAYPGGARIWVAATDEPNECVGASNGEFTSSGVIGPAVSKAFASGRWAARTPVSCDRSYQDIGRLGQGTAMVPAGSTSVTICALNARTRTLTSGYQALVSALNRLPTRPSTHVCSGTPGPSGAYEIFFSYSEGPPVLVAILVGCHPAIGNGDLQATSASSVVPVIQQLLKPA